jgi:hypothetical protein
MKFWRKTALLGLTLVLALAFGALAMEKAELINGTHWTKWSMDAKLVYIRGFSNMADFEAAASGHRNVCLSKALSEELKAKTLGQIVADVDNFYKENPDKMSTSVIEVTFMRCTKYCPPEAKKEKKP